MALDPLAAREAKRLPKRRRRAWAQHQHAHDHGHDHGHGLGHVHAPANFGRAFAIGVALNAGFVVLEVVFGLLGHSVALLADAGHNLSDALGLGVAWAAVILAKRRPTKRFTYGLGGTSILAAPLQRGLPARGHGCPDVGGDPAVLPARGRRGEDRDDRRGLRDRPQRPLRVAVLVGAEGRPERAGRLHAHGGRRARLARRRRRWPDHPPDGMALGRPRHDARDQRRDRVGGPGAFSPGP